MTVTIVLLLNSCYLCCLCCRNGRNGVEKNQEEKSSVEDKKKDEKVCVVVEKQNEDKDRPALARKDVDKVRKDTIKNLQRDKNNLKLDFTQTNPTKVLRGAAVVGGLSEGLEMSVRPKRLCERRSDRRNAKLFLDIPPRNVEEMVKTETSVDDFRPRTFNLTI